MSSSDDLIDSKFEEESPDLLSLIDTLEDLPKVAVDCAPDDLS